MKKVLSLPILLIIFLAGCFPTAPVTQVDLTVEPAEKIETPLPAGTVQTELRHAKSFTVEYRESYKILTVLKPWRGANRTFTYYLVPRGTPIPADTGDAQVIEIPVRHIASLATTHLPYLDELGDLDKLAAIGNAQYVNTPGVLQRLQEGSIKAVGNGPDINLEGLIDLQPDMVTTLALGTSSKDDYQALMQKGIKTVIFSDFMEETPLGRAEWVKFMALFFNQEAQAEEIFSGVEARYEKMRALAEKVSTRPTVLLGFEINGKWNMPGGKSYQATYVKDAGGDYLWQDDDTSGRIPMSFEAVLDKGIEADYWFDQSVGWLTARDILASDSRYEKILAYQRGQVFNNNARLSAGGGNDYNEGGLANPDVILADLISILHPELLPGHTPVYYRPLTTGGN